LAFPDQGKKVLSMSLSPYCLAAAASLVTGFDRTAAFQSMIARPIIAAPLTGWLLNDVLLGLQIGALLELLWLGRLPIGAAVPPDDTQVAVGSTCLAITQYPVEQMSAGAFAVLCLLVALPFGKVGALLDRLARHCNGRLVQAAEMALREDCSCRVARWHLQGLLHFGLASLGTYVVIMLGGGLVLRLVVPLIGGDVSQLTGELKLLISLVGVAACLGTSHVRWSVVLFCLAFFLTFGLLLMVR
jgi:PTS system mannose-specific IIC component